MAGNFTLPNPLTPLAWLPPTLANQYEASRYVYVATLGAFLWDWLTSLPQEIQLIRNHRSLPTLVYFASRFGTMAYILTSTIFQIAPVANCQSLIVAIGCCYILAGPTTGLLFFLRVRAIFHEKYWIIGFFALAWLSTLAAGIAVPFGVKAASIGTTSYCIDAVIAPFVAGSSTSNMIFDTLVFIAISAKLLSMNQESSRVNAFVKGAGFSSRLSAALFQSGQIYYFATVGMSLLVTVLLYADVPAVFHVMFTIPNLALESAMACRVFRMLKFDVNKRTYVDSLAATGGDSRAPASFQPFRTDIESSHAMVKITHPGNITITKQVETDETLRKIPSY